LTNYGDAVEIAVEHIEKTPLLHFYPGSKILSIGTNGCNMGCSFCQNWEVSQHTYPTSNLTPAALVEKIAASGVIGVCYTYNEPFIWYEYLEDSAHEVKESGYQVVVNTNGLIEPEPLKRILPLIDAINLDIKGFSAEYHRTVCKAPLAPVLTTAKILKDEGKHFEIAHLIIPGENEEDCLPLGEWILSNLGPSVPIHLNAYYPRYKMAKAATPENLVIEMCEAYAKMGHRYVYPGNTLSKKHTLCYKCNEILIERSLKDRALVRCPEGKCPSCGEFNHIVVAQG
jgi:pyruvate formate lyase activating enzyme